MSPNRACGIVRGSDPFTSAGFFAMVQNVDVALGPDERLLRLEGSDENEATALSLIDAPGINPTGLRELGHPRCRAAGAIGIRPIGRPKVSMMRTLWRLSELLYSLTFIQSA